MEPNPAKAGAQSASVAQEPLGFFATYRVFLYAAAFYAVVFLATWFTWMVQQVNPDYATLDIQTVLTASWPGATTLHALAPSHFTNSLPLWLILMFSGAIYFGIIVQFVTRIIARIRRRFRRPTPWPTPPVERDRRPFRRIVFALALAYLLLLSIVPARVIVDSIALRDWYWRESGSWREAQGLDKDALARRARYAFLNPFLDRTPTDALSTSENERSMREALTWPKATPGVGLSWRLSVGEGEPEKAMATLLSAATWCRRAPFGEAQTDLALKGALAAISCHDGGSSLNAWKDWYREHGRESQAQWIREALREKGFDVTDLSSPQAALAVLSIIGSRRASTLSRGDGLARALDAMGTARLFAAFNDSPGTRNVPEKIGVVLYVHMLYMFGRDINAFEGVLRALSKDADPMVRASASEKLRTVLSVRRRNRPEVLAWSVPLKENLGNEPRAMVADAGQLFVAMPSGILSFSEEDGHLLWRAERDSDYSTLALSSTALFAVALDTSEIYAFGRSNGTLLWTASAGQFSIGGWKRHWLIASGDSLFLASEPGLVQRFNAATGAAGSPLQLAALSGRPDVADGILYAPTKDGLLAVTLGSPSVSKLLAPVECNSGCTASDSSCFVVAGKKYVSGQLLRVAIVNGAIQWSVPCQSGNSGDTPAAPVIDGGVIYFGGVAIDARSGQLLWGDCFAPQSYVVVAHVGTISENCFPGSGCSIDCYDKRSGDLVWDWCPDTARNAAACGDGDALYVVYSDCTDWQKPNTVLMKLKAQNGIVP